MQGGSRGAQELQAGRIDAMHVGLLPCLVSTAPVVICALWLQ